eukprot:2021943-Prymnesium_polylepis.1
MSQQADELPANRPSASCRRTRTKGKPRRSRAHEGFIALEGQCIDDGSDGDMAACDAAFGD